MVVKPGLELEICAFIKAVDRQYYHSFINDGEICLNTSKWFRDYEAQDGNIGDGSEGAIASCAKDFTWQFADPILSYSSNEDLEEQLNNRNWSDPVCGESLKMFNSNNANILSLYAITLIKTDKKAFKHLVPKRFIEEFANHKFVLILNPKKFVTRIAEALIEIGKPLRGGIVNYYPSDSILRKDLTFFDKREKYSYQHATAVPRLRIKQVSVCCSFANPLVRYRAPFTQLNNISYSLLVIYVWYIPCKTLCKIPNNGYPDL